MGARAVNRVPYEGMIRTQCPKSFSLERTSLWFRGSLLMALVNVDEFDNL